MTFSVESFIIAALVGILIGVLSGMLGVGGGTIMVPAFSLGFGLTAIQSTATSLFTMIPTAIAGSITHIKQRTCVVGLGVAAGLGGACFSPVGVWLADKSPSWAIMLAASAVIIWSSVKMFRKAIAAPKKAAVDAHQLPAPRTLPFKQLVKGFFIGCLAGLAAGYVGIGGGFLMNPLFVAVLGMSMKHSSGTSLLAIAILSIPGVAEQMMLGNVVVWLAVAVACGSVPGSILGARLVTRIPERGLRFAFSILLAVCAVIMVWREVVGL